MYSTYRILEQLKGRASEFFSFVQMNATPASDVKQSALADKVD